MKDIYNINIYIYIYQYILQWITSVIVFPEYTFNISSVVFIFFIIVGFVTIAPSISYNSSIFEKFGILLILEEYTILPKKYFIFNIYLIIIYSLYII